MQEKYNQLLKHAKYALLDLKGVLEQLDLSGDHEHEAWETVKELDNAILQIDPNFQTVVDWGNRTCEQCNGVANFYTSPEGQLCGVCGQWICNNCQDCSVGLGKEPFSDEDVVCKSCSQSKK